MTVTRNFALAVMALALVIFLLFGGPGLIALGIGAYFWHLAPYRRGVHSETSAAHHALFLPQQDARETLPGPRRPVRYFLQLLLCVGLIALGLLRFENFGLLGTALLG
ncbi:MAG: hypothetical protein ACE5DS_01420 [Kiloniellaceae bacterium]